ncbi:hypothetical protein IAR50_004431 [Cryptococcus sp. DSM 104548]
MSRILSSLPLAVLRTSGPTASRLSKMHHTHTMSRTFARLPTLHISSIPFHTMPPPPPACQIYTDMNDSAPDTVSANPELSPEEMAHVFSELGALALGDERRKVLLKLLGAEEVFGPDGQVLP